jgi:predicted PurR-regulated permease PerM
VERAAGWAWRLLVCAAAIALVLALLWYLNVIVLPAIIALTVAPALTPLADWLRRRGARRAAPGIALVIGILVLAGLVSIVSVSVARESDELAATLRRGLDDLTAWLEGPPLNLALERDRSLSESLQGAWDQASGYLLSGVRSGVSVLTGLVLVVALLYFMLRDGRSVWRRVVNLFAPESRESVDRAGRRAWDVLGGFVRGTALIASIDATLIGLGLWISACRSCSPSVC